jgi:LPXTG-site transpeptidase (sortase) family protein
MVLDSGPGGQSPEGSPEETPPRQFPFKILGAVVVVAAIAVLLVVVASGGGGNDNEVTLPPSDSGGLLDEAQPSPEATIDLNRPTATAPLEHLTGFQEGDRLVISKLGLSGSLAYKKVDPRSDGSLPMPDPSTPDEVAYYDFSAGQGLGGAPGRGGNTVLSGHVDSGSKPCNNGTVPPPCQAVFWDVRNLKVGDEIEIHLTGQVYKYTVTANESVHAVSGPWDQIVAATEKETLTLITCGGQFVAGEYTHRTVVTATRV